MGNAKSKTNGWFEWLCRIDKFQPVIARARNELKSHVIIYNCVWISCVKSFSKDDDDDERDMNHGICRVYLQVNFLH